jgi:hypothetical protein
MKKLVGLLSSTLVAGVVGWMVQPLMGGALPSDGRGFGGAIYGGGCARGASAVRKYCTACGGPVAQAQLLLITGTTWRATNAIDCSDNNGVTCVTYYQSAAGCNG